MSEMLAKNRVRATSMMRDDLLYHLFMSPKHMPRTVQLRICITSHEHYPILANSCFHHKWAFCRSSLRARARSRREKARQNDR